MVLSQLGLALSQLYQSALDERGTGLKRPKSRNGLKGEYQNAPELAVKFGQMS